MNLVNSALPVFPHTLSRQPVDVPAKTAEVNAAAVASASVNQLAASSSGGADKAAEYEVFATEGDRFNRSKRGLGKMFKKRPASVEGGGKGPSGGKTPDEHKLPRTHGQGPETSGGSKYEQEVKQEQADYKPKNDASDKIGKEDVDQVKPPVFTSTLYVPGAHINGRPVPEFSTTELKKANTELQEAQKKPDAELEPVKKNKERYKRYAKKVGITVVSATAAGGTAGGTAAIIEEVKSGYRKNPADVAAAGIRDARTVDRVQDDVFSAHNALNQLHGEPKLVVPFEWSLKSNDQRMISLESIVIDMEKEFRDLAKQYGIETSFTPTRNDDTSIEGRAKAIEARLAVITALNKELAGKIKP